jgi:hypothetical protein
MFSGLRECTSASGLSPQICPGRMYAPWNLVWKNAILVMKVRIRRKRRGSVGLYEIDGASDVLQVFSLTRLAQQLERTVT